MAVYLSNLDELIQNYRFFMMRLQLVDSNNSTIDVEGIDQILTLENGAASFYTDNFTDGTTYYVKCMGGTYMSFPWGSGGWTTYNPTLYCQVTQAG